MQVMNLNSLEQQLLEIQKQINDCLNKEVAQHVKEQIMTAISIEVYGAGIPQIYVRRGGNVYGGMGNTMGTGSLADPQEMHHTVSNCTLKVTDDAQPSNPGFGLELDEAITYGYGRKNMWWNKPRPFLSEAVENMETTNSHVEVMKEGLEKRLGKGNVIQGENILYLLFYP